MFEFCSDWALFLWDSERNLPDLSRCLHHFVLPLIPLFPLLPTPWKGLEETKAKKKWRKDKLKWIILIVLIIFQLLDAVLTWNVNTTETNVYSPLLRLSTTLIIASISADVKQSSCLATYFACLLANGYSARVFGQARGWQEWHENLLPVEAAMVLLIWMLTGKADRYQKLGEENYVRTSIFSHLFLSWYTPTLLTGWKRPVEFSDLVDFEEDDRAEKIREKWRRSWKETYPKGSSGKDVNLLWIIWKNFGNTYIVATILDTIMICVQQVTPRLQGLLISYVQDAGEDGDGSWGYFLALGMFVSSMFDTVVTTRATFILLQMGTGIRSALMTAIYDKVLRLSPSAKQKFTDGEIFNFVSVDSTQFNDLAFSINTHYNAALIIGLSLWSLWGYLGPSCLAGLAVVALIVPANSVITRGIKRHQQEAMRLSDLRIRVVSEAVDGIKAIKFNAWERPFKTKIQDIREQELRCHRSISLLTAAQNFFLQSAPFLVAVSTFATYVWSDPSHVLTAEKAFVSISYFNIIRHPMAWLPNFFSQITKAYVSVTRMNRFLGAKEVDEANIGTPAEENIVIQVNDAKFSWDEKESKLAVKSIQVLKGELIAVVGRVGAGKSSFLSCLLNEMEKMQGEVCISGSTAYLPASAFIKNATLRDNILFGYPYDEKWYQQVLHACGLLPDLQLLDNEDLTEIGEKGVNLSGGQKQRVGLARAVYSRKDIYLLDDPLSAVDVHVGKHIFDHCFDPKGGILKGKTVILVTNSPTYLPKMNRVVVLEDGSIKTIGDLHSVREDLSFLGDHSQSHSVEENMTPDAKGSQGPKEDGKETVTRNKPNVEKGLVKAEKVELHSVSRQVYTFYLKKIGPLVAAAAVLLHLCNQFLFMCTNWWLARWTSDGESGASTRHYVSVYGLLGALASLSMVGATLAVLLGGLRAAAAVHLGLLDGVLHTALGFFDANPRGRIVNRFSSDVNAIDSHLPNNFNFAVTFAFELLFTVLVISSVSASFLLFIVPVVALAGLVHAVYVKTSRQLKRLNSVNLSPVFSHVGETLSGIATVRAFGAAEDFRRQHVSNVDSHTRCFLNNGFAQQWMRVRMELVSGAVMLSAAVLSVAARRGGGGGEDGVTPGMVGLSISYALQLSVALRTLLGSLAHIEARMVSVERLLEYQRLPAEDEGAVVCDVADGWPGDGAVRFADYRARYRSDLDDVLRGLDLDIRPREKVGVVGRTGAGKSSLTMALFRLMGESRGDIAVDGKSIGSVPLEKLRSRMSIIPQEPVLFSGPMRFNVDPFGEHSVKEVDRALARTGLSGLRDLEVSEKGANLSSGQRQLVCLARALLRRSKILVLDEATAAVDPETERVVQQTIKEDFKDSTIITIAHRLETVMGSDRVAVMSEGKIVEFDSPAKLMAQRGSKFSAMINSAAAVGKRIVDDV